MENGLTGFEKPVRPSSFGERVSKTRSVSGEGCVGVTPSPWSG